MFNAVDAALEMPMSLKWTFLIRYLLCLQGRITLKMTKMALLHHENVMF